MSKAAEQAQETKRGKAGAPALKYPVSPPEAVALVKELDTCSTLITRQAQSGSRVKAETLKQWEDVATRLFFAMTGRPPSNAELEDMVF